MNGIECPGLPADWLNSWLASIGLLVLEPRLRLSWTPERSPIAVFSAEGTDDPLELAVQAWPQTNRLKCMPIARHLKELPEMERTVPLGVFKQRAEYARSHTDSWTLSSCITDLEVERPANTVSHAYLDPTAPRGTTLHDRLVSCFHHVESPQLAVPATLQGYGRRVKANGLGFDASRIAGLADSSKTYVDPVIEVLAFFGLRLLPMRGEGLDVGKSGARHRFAARQRCWSLDRGQSSRAQRMTWPAWTPALDLAGVDALIDVWAGLHERQARGQRTSHAELSRLGVHAAWETRAYIGRGSSDATKGFMSTRVKLGAGGVPDWV